MLKYREEWAFVSPRGGLGGPPSFVACYRCVTEMLQALSNESYAGSVIPVFVFLAMLYSLATSDIQPYAPTDEKRLRSAWANPINEMGQAGIEMWELSDWENGTRPLLI
jgi:hypothetical protein